VLVQITFSPFGPDENVSFEKTVRINLFPMYIYKFLINLDEIDFFSFTATDQNCTNHNVWKLRVLDLYVQMYTSSHQVLSLLHNMYTMSSHFACKNCTNKFLFDAVKYTGLCKSTEMNAI